MLKEREGDRFKWLRHASIDCERDAGPTAQACATLRRSCLVTSGQLPPGPRAPERSLEQRGDVAAHGGVLVRLARGADLIADRFLERRECARCGHSVGSRGV